MKRVSQPKWQRNMNGYIKSLSTVNNFSSSNIKYCLGAFFKFLVEETTFALNTIRLRYIPLSYFIDWLQSSYDIHDLACIDTPILRKFLLYCKDVRNQKGNMLKCSKVAIKHFFTFLFDSGIISSNPAAGITTPTRCPVRERAILNNDEIFALFNAPRKKLEFIKSNSDSRFCNGRHIFTTARDVAIISVLLSTGIRTQELCDINLSDIDLDKRIIHINGKGNHLYIKRHRTVFIDVPQVISSINNFLELRQNHKCSYMFCSWDDYPLKNSCISKVVDKYSKLAGINRKVTPMLIRHTFCSLMTINEADPFSVRELMGHQKVLTTLHYYTHFSRDQIKHQMTSFNPLV